MKLTHSNSDQSLQHQIGLRFVLISKRSICNFFQSRIRLVSGCLAGLSGLMILAAVSWYANDVRLQHERVSQRLLVNSAESAYR